MIHPQLYTVKYIDTRSNSMFWPKLCYNMKFYIIKCLEYQVNKAKHLKVVCLLHPLDIPNNKWD